VRLLAAREDSQFLGIVGARGGRFGGGKH
jgi:hypothetical protein